MNKLITILISMSFVVLLFLGIIYAEGMVYLHHVPRIIYIFPMAMSFFSGFLLGVLVLTDRGEK